MINYLIAHPDGSPFEVDLFASRVPAGFSSPADDHLDLKLDIAKLLATNKTTTFYVWADGDSMVGEGANIPDGALCHVDRSLKPKNGDIVLAKLEDQFTIKKLRLSERGNITLMPANPRFEPIPIHPEQDFAVWGIIVWVIHPTNSLSRQRINHIRNNL